MERPLESFLGVPFEPDLGRVEADAIVIGVPEGVRYPHQGDAEGSTTAPAAIRAASRRFARFLEHHDFDLGGSLLPEGYRVVDAGDVRDSPAVVTQSVATILDRGAVPIVLGGDDSVPIPVLRAFERHGPIAVVQVDAHLDFRDEVAGVREGYSSPMRRASEMAWIERIVQVGLRGVGSARESDVDDALAAGNVLIRAREVRQRGIRTVFDRVDEDARVFISLDLDGLDPSVAPAVNAPLPGGLTFDECSDLLRGLASERRVVGAVLTELAPSLDATGLSALVAVRLLAQLVGEIARVAPRPVRFRTYDRPVTPPPTPLHP